MLWCYLSSSPHFYSEWLWPYCETDDFVPKKKGFWLYAIPLNWFTKRNLFWSNWQIFSCTVFNPSKLNCRLKFLVWDLCIMRCSTILKVHTFWEGHKILRNLHLPFDLCSASQIIGGDFGKFCGLLRIQNIWTLKIVLHRIIMHKSQTKNFNLQFNLLG